MYPYQRQQFCEIEVLNKLDRGLTTIVTHRTLRYRREQFHMTFKSCFAAETQQNRILSQVHKEQ